VCLARRLSGRSAFRPTNTCICCSFSRSFTLPLFPTARLALEGSA
jgi:hypothetical protein